MSAEGNDQSLWDVVVVPYDGAWPRMFEAFAAEIRAACGDAVLAVEHVGSTSVPGLPAKPIIDIEVLTPSFEAAGALLPALESLGYELDPGSPIPEYYTPWRPATLGRLQVNVALHAADHPDGIRRVAFRDYLRMHSEVATEYANLKRELAARYAHDGSSYTGGKTRFVRRIRRITEGLGPDTISVEPYDPAWPARFEVEASRIRDTTGDGLLAIEHIGSTSVPGLAAKPIIDMMGLVPSFEAGRRLVVPIRRLGYLYYGENDIPRRQYFVLEDASGHDVFHLHILEEGSTDARNHILFRDYLRAHADAQESYTAFKQDLIAQYANDRRAYTEAKADFIAGILARARGASVTGKRAGSFHANR